MTRPSLCDRTWSDYMRHGVEGAELHTLAANDSAGDDAGLIGEIELGLTNYGLETHHIIVDRNPDGSFDVATGVTDDTTGTWFDWQSTCETCEPAAVDSVVAAYLFMAESSDFTRIKRITRCE